LKKFNHSFNYLDEIQNSFNFICHPRCYSFALVVNYLNAPHPDGANMQIEST
jgi:hypothetical protein